MNGDSVHGSLMPGKISAGVSVLYVGAMFTDRLYYSHQMSTDTSVDMGVHTQLISRLVYFGCMYPCTLTCQSSWSCMLHVATKLTLV